MRIKTREAMEMLFAAKWNLPKAAKHADLTNKEMKITFNEYCVFHQPTYEVDKQIGVLYVNGSVAESVDAPDLKSVGR
jgi:hypothetical protein